MLHCARLALFCVAIMSLPIDAHAQTATAAPRAWSFQLTGNTYFLPDEPNYVQPTVTADRHTLHLESRYHYEDAGSTSIFGGWNLEFGDTLKLELTPMIGGLFGRTNGIVPALEGTLTWRRLEFYSEGEYVLDPGETSHSFFYNWSELSVWPTEWFRTGVVTQRTRVIHTPRDIQRGLIVGIAAEKIEGAFYWFNPGADDRFFVASIGVKF